MQTFTLARRGETRLSTWGELSGPNGGVICKILERGACNPDHVRIPAATYTIQRKPLGSSEFDGTFKDLLGDLYKGILWLPNVPGRSNIEIHSANVIEQLLGCLATGTSISLDTNKDYMISGGTSRPGFVAAYKAISPAIDAGGAQIAIHDIAELTA